MRDSAPGRSFPRPKEPVFECHFPLFIGTLQKSAASYILWIMRKNSTDYRKKRKNSVIVSDLDLTLTSRNLMDELMAHQYKTGILGADLGKSIREAKRKACLNGIPVPEGGTETLDLWAEGLEGRRYDEVVDDAVSFFSRSTNLFYPYFPRLADMFSGTHDFYIVTAGLQIVADAVCRIFGLAGYRASRVLVAGNRLCGKIVSALVRPGSKGAVVGRLLRNYSWEGSIGIGDTENDISMLEKIANPFCINPNEGLMAAAKRKRWTIVNSGNIMNEIERKLVPESPVGRELGIKARVSIDADQYWIKK